METWTTCEALPPASLTTPKSIAPAEVEFADSKLANDYVFVCIGGELPTAWLAKIGIEVKTMRGEAHPALAGS